MTADTKREQGEKNRKQVERALGARPKSVPDLASKLGMKQSTTMRHLKALVASGGAVAERAGRTIVYRKAA